MVVGVVGGEVNFRRVQGVGAEMHIHKVHKAGGGVNIHPVQLEGGGENFHGIKAPLADHQVIQPAEEEGIMMNLKHSQQLPY